MSPTMIYTRVCHGRWEVVHPGVYRIAGSAVTWTPLALAACLGAGPSAAASHVTAGVLWGVIVRKQPPIHVTVPYASNPASLGFVVHRSRIPFESVDRDCVPTTSVDRTFLDLASVLRESELEDALDKALHRRLTTVERLVAILDSSGSGRKGAGKLRRLVDARSGRRRHPESVFETRVMRILRRAGLPLPQLQFDVRRDGHLIGRVDLCYPEQRIFIELEGWEYHSSRQAFDAGYIRRNLIVELGWLPLGFTWSDLRRPRYVADTVRRILKQRGHPAV